MAPVQDAVLIAVPAPNRATGEVEPAGQARALLARCLLEDAAEVVRLRSLGDFHKASYSKAMVFAYAALKDRREAEDVVAETYVEFLKGRTTGEHFFRALKANIVDRQRRLTRERRVFEASENVLEPGQASGEDGAAGCESEEFSPEPVSLRPEDQDPLEILIQREEAEARQAMVGRAMADPRWRYIKRKKWARPLVGDVPK